ncbi:SgcJ/EcaC family oxidoreductase [Mesorhizobium sp. M0701]|uniref:YybH family protein n=1 Tax=Mesorhizobium sp. M0701 TaxID=2956989 RepID=UPI00333A1C90
MMSIILRKNLAALALAALPLIVLAAPAKSDEPVEAAIMQQLQSYEQALNNSDAKAVVKLYTDDSVLMPQETPTVVGIKAVEQFYVATFQAIDINLHFQIAEIQVVSDEWAFLRTTSAGTMKIHATGNEVPSHNQELFVLHKEVGAWKLARYSFSSTLPPAQR